ncbi:hypothetical protein AB6N23_07465 [Cellulomonas sp. 179-A 9B4 NHS]|uniref:hypothetical protein n=1 Tax=Cellulomonas sp. 179-A 9B4 NHS TaxID=3142379 RepID=UPI0039A3E450
MKKHLPTAAFFGLMILAGVVYFAAENVLLAAAVAALAVTIWGFTPSGFGHVPKRGPVVSPKELREYRRQHPGATIADAIEHAGR